MPASDSLSLKTARMPKACGPLMGKTQRMISLVGAVACYLIAYKQTGSWFPYQSPWFYVGILFELPTIVHTVKLVKARRAHGS